jgi:hypothetical protein
MNPKAKRQATLLVGLVVVLVAALWWNIGREATPGLHPSPRGTAGGAHHRSSPVRNVASVRLEALKADHPDVDAASRNPFRFQPQAPPPPEQTARTEPVNPVAARPTGPPAPQPIPLRFIGILDAPEQHRKFAVLSDGRGTLYGQEGDIIDGRYRILRIGVESIEMVYIDGRGQQTIRLSGS